MTDIYLIRQKGAHCLGALLAGCSSWNLGHCGGMGCAYPERPIWSLCCILSCRLRSYSNLRCAGEETHGHGCRNHRVEGIHVRAHIHSPMLG
jgi:hypothetical protein